MTSSDEGQDRELLERYRRAGETDPSAPSAAVRAAILDEGRRVAASLSVPASTEPVRPRYSRWRMTAWGTAAAALLAALIIAPRFWNQPPVHIVALSKKTELAEPAAEPRPVAPVMPMPPPVHIPEQAQLASLAQAHRMNPSHIAGSDHAQEGTNASTPLLSAAVAAGDLVKTTQLLDQGAAINDRDATGRTPLMVAIGQNQLDTVRLLLDRGADPNAADPQGLTPLALAQQSSFGDIAALLIKAGAH